eukprot:4978686-Pleurochrysis_carterae.AAC.1
MARGNTVVVSLFAAVTLLALAFALNLTAALALAVTLVVAAAIAAAVAVAVAVAVIVAAAPLGICALTAPRGIPALSLAFASDFVIAVATTPTVFTETALVTATVDAFGAVSVAVVANRSSVASMVNLADDVCLIVAVAFGIFTATTADTAGTNTTTAVASDMVIAARIALVTLLAIVGTRRFSIGFMCAAYERPQELHEHSRLACPRRALQQRQRPSHAVVGSRHLADRTPL